MVTEQEILTNQLDNMVEATRLFASAMNHWCGTAPNPEMLEKDATIVIELEKKGDRINESFIEHLYSGGAVHFSKADKLVLSEKIDKILDVLEIGARYMLMRPATLKIPDTIHFDIKSMEEKLGKTAEALKECILLVNKDFDEAREKAREVEDQRREVRDLEWKILKTLLNLKTIDAEILFVKQIIELHGMVADKMEALSDFVDTIAIKYKTLR